MAKEYKTLTFDDSDYGRKEMDETINFYTKYGWEIKSKETIQQGWSFGKTCCFGILFLPLALLGKKNNVIQVFLEREISPKNKQLDEEMAKAEAERPHYAKPMSGTMKAIIAIIIFFAVIGIISNAITDSATNKIKVQQGGQPSVTQVERKIPYEVKRVNQKVGILDFILINPQFVNTNDLTALGQELHSDYKSDSFVNISIYDDIKAVNIRSKVVFDEPTQSETELYDAHYVGQYNKNQNTGYESFAILQDGSGKMVNKIINF